MIVNITGVFYLPSGAVASSRMVAFKPIDRSVRAGYLGGLVPDPVIIQTGIDGSVDFNLLTGSYFVTIEAKDTDNIGLGLIFAGKANVPDAPSASISEILDAAVAPDVPPVWYMEAVHAAEDAIDAAVAAQAWAESPTPPGGAGTESAKTAANRAAAAAQDAEDAAASIGNAVRYDAQTLTAPQQAQARDNIGAADSATAVTVAAQAFTPEQQAIAQVNVGLAITGMVAMFAGSAPPAGWLNANGADVSRTTYAALYAAIGTTYGAGDGSTTFAIPDLRGEFVRGWDGGRGVDAGRVFGSAQGDAIRNITGTIDNVQKQINTAFVFTGAFAQRGDIYSGAGNSSGSSPALGVEFDASRVVPTADENRPRNIALLPCIKY